MDRIFINGGNPLRGEVTISGAKNAVVAILPAVILAQDVCVIENVPDISDVNMMIKILKQLGAKIKRLGDTTYEIDSTTIDSWVVTHDMTKHLRASYYFIGALLARFGRAKVALPGGCNFGERPINQHVDGFRALGANVMFEIDGKETVSYEDFKKLEKENAANGISDFKDNVMVIVEADELIGSHIYFDKVSVGATVNVMLAAIKAKGLTAIENAAREPHIVDLANFLNQISKTLPSSDVPDNDENNINHAGMNTVLIRGAENLHGCTYSIIPDQIEAGTFMVAAAATKGDVRLKNVTCEHLDSITKKLIQTGACVEISDDKESVRVSSVERLKNCSVITMPHPGFPTDMQPQIATLLAVAEGTSTVTEAVWDNRFQYVEQLKKMGANISVSEKGETATIEGVEELHGADVEADDLRAGAAMIIAGLVAKGTTSIGNTVYIDRGYDNVVSKFKALGADIWREETDDND